MLCITLSLGGLLGTLKTLRLGQLEELQKLQELGKLEASKQSGHDGRSGQLEQSGQLEHPNLHRSPSKMPAHRTRPKLNRSVCWIWLVSNAIGLYSHYFFVLVLAVEGMIVLGWLVRWRFGFSHGDQLWRSPRSAWLKPWCTPWRTLWHTSWITPLGVPIVLFLPWALQLVAHINRAETNWSKPFDPSWSDRFAPIVQTLIGWVSLLVALPIHANLLIQVVGGGLGLLAAGVLSRWLLRSLHQRREPEAAIVVSYIGLFIGVMWLLAYGFGKDMTIVPRYHAVYYPALCLWLALAVEPTSLSSFSLRSELFELWHGLKRVYRRTFQGVPLDRLEHLQSCQSWQQWGRSCRLQPIAWVLLISLLGSSLVTHNLAFPKPYTPREFAQRLLRVDSGSVDSGRVKSGRSARSAELAGLAGSAQFIAPPALPSAKTQTPAAETGKLLTAPTVVIGYENLQEIALGWSILWEVANQALTPEHFPEHSPATLPQFALLDRTSGYAQLWQRLSELAPLPRSSPVGDLWVIAPGLRQAEFPATLTILRSSSQALLNQALLNQAPIAQARPTQNPLTQATSTAYPCTQADDRYGRLGIPFQGYRCSS